LNDIGGVGNEAECELIMYNKSLEKDADKKYMNEKDEKKYLEEKEKEKEKEKKEDEKSNFSNKDNKWEYFEKYDFKRHYCTYVYVRGTVPIKMKMEIESAFSKPKIIMFYLKILFNLKN
jgi:hypothetical protein